jgi:hypothetical protein
VDTYEKQSSLEGDVNGATGGLRVTDEKQSSLEGDVNGDARGSRGGESVGRGHI